MRAWPRSRPTCAGTCRCGCSAACTTSCSAATRARDDVDAMLDGGAGFLARFAAEQPVRRRTRWRARGRCCPGLLSIGAERIDLIELGPSAGLLLALDRYGYRYSAGELGRRFAAAVRRRPGRTAGAAARAAARDRAAARNRRRPDRRRHAGRPAPARGVRLGRPGGTPRPPPRGDRVGGRRCRSSSLRGDYVDCCPACCAIGATMRSPSS